MRRRIVIGTLGTAVIVAVGISYVVAFAQTGQPASPSIDEQAIRKATDAYADASNQRDLARFLSFWTDDAEYIDEDGKSIKGRAALSAMFKQASNDNKEAKVEIKTTAIRFLKDDVALQDGNVIMTLANGDVDRNAYSAVWLKKDGKWLLNRVRDFASPAEPAPDPAASLRIKELAWLVGDWTLEEKDTKTAVTGRWLKGQKFLALDYRVATKGNEVLALTQIIGWDPTSEQFHSWVFDSHGGFGEGAWTRKGKSWTVEVAGVTLYGQHGTGTTKWTLVGDDRFVYEAFDRNLDGQPLPDVKVTYQRAAKGK
jgi:uncharacterized protein (TIGR02246 family)